MLRRQFQTALEGNIPYVEKENGENGGGKEKEKEKEKGKGKRKRKEKALVVFSRANCCIFLLLLEKNQSRESTSVKRMHEHSPTSL